MGGYTALLCDRYWLKGKSVEKCWELEIADDGVVLEQRHLEMWVVDWLGKENVSHRETWPDWLSSCFMVSMSINTMSYVAMDTIIGRHFDNVPPFDNSIFLGQFCFNSLNSCCRYYKKDTVDMAMNFYRFIVQVVVYSIWHGGVKMWLLHQTVPVKGPYGPLFV